MAAIYRGFSSFEFQANKTFTLTDIDLVEMDLLNHIFTRRGSRVMMSNFGTIIPDLVFEPLDGDTLDAIEEDLIAVFEYDPRVEMLDLVIRPDYDNNVVTASAQLFYIELNVASGFEFNIQFEG